MWQGPWISAKASGNNNKYFFLTPLKVLIVLLTDFILFPMGRKFYSLEKYFVKD